MEDKTVLEIGRMKNVVEEMRKVITCAICLDVYVDPVSLNSCRHSFCRNCITAAALMNKKCPICITPFLENNLSASTFLKPIILQIDKLSQILKTKYSPQEITTTLNLKPNNALQAKKEVNMLNSLNRERIFKIGDVVFVERRTWAGINKPGGVGRITEIHNGGDSFDVKYILDSSKEKNIPLEFVKINEDESKERRRKYLDSPLSSVSNSQHLSKRNRNISSSTPENLNVHSSHLHHLSSKKIVIVTSGLDDKEQELVQEFSQSFSRVILEMSFGSADSHNLEVTHLIVSCPDPTDSDSENRNRDNERKRERVFPPRTMKYLQSIMSGVLVVDIDWVKDSILEVKKQNQREGQREAKDEGNRESERIMSILSEVDYLVNKCGKSVTDDAPERARKQILRQEGSCGLFLGMVVLLFGCYPSPHPPRSQLQGLLEMGKAIVMSDIESFVNKCFPRANNDKDNKRKYNRNERPINHRIVICLDSETRATFIKEAKEIINNKFYTNNFENKRESDEDYYMNIFLKSVYILNPLWILDCVTDYSVNF